MTFIANSGRFQVCAETNDVPRARELFVQHSPEIVVLGLTLHGGDGIELIKDFRKLNRAARTLVLTVREDALAIHRAFRAGARGYLVAHDDLSEILRAFDQILSGELYASPSVSRQFVESFANGATKHNGSEITPLSDRELQVFALFGRGFGATRLARELHLSVKTIETHQMRIKEKLGLRSASQLNEKAVRWVLDATKRQLQRRAVLAS